jgi:cobalt-zinc-cadmium efflux system protein
MSSHHNHNHHGHTHQKQSYNNAFLIAISANGVFVLLQVFFALFAHSTSLLADAVHNFGDVMGLILAFVATLLIKRKPTEKTTFGLKKSSILAALANGILLVFTCGVIASDALYKLFFPTEVHAVYVMIIAAIGIVVNGATATLFARGSSDLNIRGAFLHLLYDAIISFGVVVSAGLMYWTGWMWIDPVVGLLIALVILKGTWSLFIDSFMLMLDGVPASISLLAVQEFLLSQPDVVGIHDLHVWAMSTQENALSVHLYMPDNALNDSARLALIDQLDKQFGIRHVTIQVERTNTHCQDMCLS